MEKSFIKMCTAQSKTDFHISLLSIILWSVVGKVNFWERMHVMPSVPLFHSVEVILMLLLWNEAHPLPPQLLKSSKNMETGYLRLTLYHVAKYRWKCFLTWQDSCIHTISVAVCYIFHMCNTVIMETRWKWRQWKDSLCEPKPGFMLLQWHKGLWHWKGGYNCKWKRFEKEPACSV